MTREKLNKYLNEVRERNVEYIDDISQYAQILAFIDNIASMLEDIESYDVMDSIDEKYINEVFYALDDLRLEVFYKKGTTEISLKNAKNLLEEYENY